MIEPLLNVLLYSIVVAVCLGLAVYFYAPEVDFTIQLATVLLFIGAIVSLLVRAIFGWYAGASMDHYVYAAALLFLVFVAGFRFTVPTSVGTTILDEMDGSDTLVVLIKGLLGPRSLTSLQKAVRHELPTVDILTSNYPSFTFSNTDPYQLANTIEHAIHRADQDHDYKRIILAGHSLGAVLLRKALVWAHGAEEDRKNLGIHGPRSWAKKVDRYVSLAGINRGWSLNPKPANMSSIIFLIACLGVAIAKATGTGKLLLATRRGAPFIADLRVQWIRIARQDHGSSKKAKLPTAIHLLGDIDDIVSREDSQDLAAAKDARFITLLNTDHQDIVTDLETGRESSERLSKIMNALFLRKNKLRFDKLKVQKEDLNIKRIVYILHGIRDYGTWAERLRSVLEKELEGQGLNEVAVTPPKYGYFPMAPFILYWDRQRNVRKFMDEYTENIAKYPNAKHFDFIGHSNGTYILASALQRYPTLKVRNVLFAGSVVPKRYKWRELVDAGRVSKVRNVVATGDWVVAIFPRFVEQIAEWLHIDSVKGVFDIGSAGFRGFDDSAKVDRGRRRRIRDTKFVSGRHSTALDIRDERKRSAIVAFAIHGRDKGIIGLKNADEPWGWLDQLSNMSLVPWLVLALLLLYLPAYLAQTFVGLKWLGIYTAYLAFLVVALFSF